MADGGVRVAFLGDSRVGKTSIIARFIRGQFGPHKSTIGAIFHAHEGKASGSGKKVILQIWDTAGEERYRSLSPIYFRGTRVGVCVFDVSNAETLDHARAWVQELRHYSDQGALVFLVGNKTDLEHDRDVITGRATEMAAELSARLWWTSAKTGTQVTELFQAIVDVVAEQALESERADMPAANDQGCGC